MKLMHESQLVHHPRWDPSITPLLYDMKFEEWKETLQYVKGYNIIY